MISTFKGWLGEKGTQFGLWLTLDKRIYSTFHNVILPTTNGTTQIDHVILSPFGIFVIETKNYSGWIYGEESQRQWTQVLYGKKYSFQNPLHQNHKHVRAIAEVLSIAPEFVHSIIFFAGEAQLKTRMPQNVLTGGLAFYVQGFKSAVFNEQDLWTLKEQLLQLQQEQGTNREHVKNLKERFANETICPKCGSPLVKRVTKKGPQTGAEFLGCSTFPQCRYIKR